jgi:large subunit ribosomal protein L28
MAKMCDITGKKKSVKNKVSHSKRRTKSIQEANLQTRAFIDPITGKKLKLRVSTKMIKTITQKGLQAVLRKFNKTDLIPS